MRQRVLALVIISIILTIKTNGLWGQVTIGSDEEPNAGALLDLKEKTNTTKGLGMPRVYLTNLKPKNGTQLANSIGGTGNWDLTEHIGLWIYNINDPDYCAVQPIYQGLYVWDGQEWQSLGVKETGPEVYKVTDPRDNEVYFARNFGTDAGDWMLENLRYIPSSGFTHSAASSYTDKHWCYAQKNSLPGNFAYNPTQAQTDWNHKWGILYNWKAVTNDENTYAINQGQIAGTTPGQHEVETVYGKIQGICPPGWHVPSDREWNKLEKEIYEHPERYSTYTGSNQFNPNNWSSTWETQQNWRGSSPNNITDPGHGNAMKSECIPPVSGGVVAKGKSLPASQGGFEMHPIGYAVGGNTNHYSFSALFWSSSFQDYSGRSWGRYFDNNNSAGGRFNNTMDHMFNVRCKKD